MDIHHILSLIKQGESEKIEFKKKIAGSINKEVCALANAVGGTIIVGVDDKGNITGCNAKKTQETLTSSLQAITPPVQVKIHNVGFEKQRLVVIEVNKSPQLCSVGGVAYIRIAGGVRPLSIQEIVTLSTEIGSIRWDEIPILEKSELNKKYVTWFFERLEDTRKRHISSSTYEKYLRSAKALKNNKLTNAGALYFSDNTDFLGFELCRVIYVEDKPVSSKEYTGTVWKVIDDVYNDLIREFSKEEIVIGTKREKIETYPLRALREALINAFAHRNYSIVSDIKIFVHSDKVVVRSPGSILAGVDIQDPEHIARNPALCQLLYDTGYVEKYGYGIRMILDECEKHPFVNVEFNVSPGKFEVIFTKNTDQMVDENDKKILSAITEPKKSSEIAKETGLSKQTVVTHLKKLVALGVARKSGRGAQVTYNQT